jgi:uncharacterized protein (DUF1810 family)
MAAGEDLARFVEAQAQVWPQVVQELTAGRKRSHWMWFIFPQLAGLGASSTAQFYALKNMEEARHYLAHPVLGPRLREGVRLMLRQKGRSARDLLGSPDDLKFRSCVTLFRHAAGDADDEALFGEAIDQFYQGKADPRTLQLLNEN